MAAATISKEAIAAFAKEHGMSEEHSAIVLREQAKEKSKAAKAKETVAKYPHAIQDTLRNDSTDAHHPWKVKIKCTSCGDTNREVALQDLFQVKHCKGCADKAKAEKRKAKAAEKKAALEAYRAALAKKK